MSGTVIVDTNVFGLLVVGTASPKYISAHKRLNMFSEFHFELLQLLLLNYDDFVLLPHIVSETSNLIRQIANPARDHAQEIFRQFIDLNIEIPTTSKDGIMRDEFIELGITDSVILHMCNLSINGIAPTLITIDGDLINKASSLGYNVVDYREFMH